MSKFTESGYLVIENVLTEAECQSIAREFTRAFELTYPDLPAREEPAWLPGLADATPCSTSLAVDDGRFWELSETLLGGDSLPCPPEVAWLRGITPWHYDDPLGLRGVKFLAYPIGPATGLRIRPLDQNEAVHIALAPGDVIAIDLHLWHSYQTTEQRLLWAPEYLAWPIDPPDPESLEKKFASVATAGTIDSGTEWPVWRDWLGLSSPSANRKRAIDLLRHAGAFDNGRDLI